MEPIGKSYGGMPLYSHAAKRYRCDRCGYVVEQTTNHYGPTWSWGHVNVCPKCPPWAKYPEFGGQTTWTCLDQPPGAEETVGPQEQAFAESIKQEADLLLEAVACQCADPACPVCGGHCDRPATTNLRRADMDDRSGTMFCSGCSEDAMSSGLFMPSVAGYIAGTRRGAIPPKAAHGMPPPPPSLPPPPKSAEMQVSWT